MGYVHALQAFSGHGEAHALMRALMSDEDCPTRPQALCTLPAPHYVCARVACLRCLTHPCVRFTLASLARPNQTPLLRTEYKQMSGRAGRAGIDPWGESFLMVRPNGSNRLQLQALVKVSSVPIPGGRVYTVSDTPSTVCLSSRVDTTVDTCLSSESAGRCWQLLAAGSRRPALLENLNSTCFTSLFPQQP